MATVSIDRSELQNRRNTLASVRLELIDALFELEDATNAFNEVKRQFAPTSIEHITADERQRQAVASLAAIRSSEKDAHDALQEGIQTWLFDRSTQSPITVDDDIARLDRTLPIVMLPIRIETRFDGDKLKVRVFPDEIFVNRHEIALTVAERDAAIKYYNDLNTRGNEKDRWREIIQRFGPERSAYILRRMRPAGFTGTSDPSFPCGEKLSGGEGAQLTFPTDVKLRSGTWTRPAEAILPDRWVVVTYRNGVRKVNVGNAIVEPIAITTDPALPEDQQTSISANPSYKIDDKLRWTVDFECAKQVGMGIEIDLDANEAAVGTGGFDRVIVFGVKSSFDVEASAAQLVSLIDAHHYTRGIALVRQGTPTNNTEDSPTPFPPDDEDGERSFRIEREHAPIPEGTGDCLPPNSDGWFLGNVLGVPNGVFANVDRAAESEIIRSIAMNVALWPLTYGYFMKVLMDPIFSDTDIEQAKFYASIFVRPRGHAPAFRVGAVPYGVLPAISIYRWQSGDAEENIFEFLTSKIIDPLRRLIPIWLDASSEVPQVTGSATDPDVELMSILSTYPSAKEIRVRHGVGDVTWYNIFSFFGFDFTLVEQRLNTLTEDLFRRLGHPEWRPRIGRVTLDPRAWRLLFPLVVDKPSEDRGFLPAENFITGIRNATVQELKDNTVSPAPNGFNFLYSLLRHATLAEYGCIADGLADAAHKWKEPELFGFPSQPTQPSIIAEALLLLASQIAEAIAPQLKALDTLAGATLAELDRLVGETLDLASHRLDAWITGVAAQRLFIMRSQTSGFGQHLGGYAWVENLRPVQRQTKTIQNVGTFEIQPGTGGYIHTPSMTHAATAAILRSAHISMKNEDPSKFAVDLSSRRVRNARRVLDEVRAGQQLGAVLGYRFERGLHEGHPGVAGLDKIRFAFRNLFPLVAGKNGVDTAELAENIAARNVVDGLALLRANRNNGIDFANDPNLPRLGTSQYNAVQDEIAKLEELHDSVADLLTAESVYQLARGNVTGAAAPLDNLVVGGPPPDPAVARSARTGIGIAHRVALVFPTDRTTDLPSGWPSPTPRALAEPTLDAWLGRIIGDPSKVTCQITFTEAPGSVTVALSDLGLRPLDVLVLASVVLEKGLGSTLDARVLAAALGSDTSKTNIQINYDPAPGRDSKVERTFPEILEVARALGAALGGGRALEIGDLLSPAEVDEEVANAETTALSDVQDIESRAKAANDALEELTNSTTVSADRSLALAIQVADPANLTDTEIANLRAALTTAALFAPERAFPSRTLSGTDLLVLAQSVQKEFQKRLDAVDKLESKSPVLAKDRAERAQNEIKAIFGGSFFAMPTLHVPRPDEISASLAARTDLIGTDASEPSRYLQQATRARANLSRFRKFSLYARALRSDPLAIYVAQLPFVPGEQWLGRKFETTDPEEGRAGVLFLSEDATIDPTTVWRGILLEQWTEVIPTKQEQTAVAFHYDTPRAAAPQAVVVAVPPNVDGPWQFEELIAILNETFDLAKIRAVDAELLPLGQTLPLAVLAQNDSPDITIATVYSAFVGAPSDEAFQGFS